MAFEKPGNKWLPYLVLTLSVLFIYWQALSFDFIPSWDDKEYVLDNIHIQSLSAENLKFIFTNTYFSNYAPLHLLSYSIDFAIWGLKPAGYHLTNIILHILNACLLFTLVSRITGDRKAGFIASLIFSLHPINIENVAWISERKTLLTTFFSFLSIVSYLNFRDALKWRYYILCFVLFLLALLAKPLTVTLPLALLAYELFIKKERKGILFPFPLFLLSILGAVMAMWAHMSHHSIEQSSLTLDVLFGTVYPTMTPIYWKYVKLIIWPMGLSGFYDAPIYGSFLDAVPAVSVIAWVSLTVLILCKGGGQMRFWYLWFWIWLLPVSNIIPIPVYYADRYMYLPAIGFFALAGLGVSKISKAPSFEKIVYAVAAIIIVFYGAAAFSRAGVWRNEVSFWKDTAEKSPGQDKARLNLGYAYEMEGLLAEAEREYQAAVNIYPSQEALSNLQMIKSKIELLRQKALQQQNP
ncbi:MAG: glycosyltransferase family 39 protein [Deltaproteobacteria bacterium]|nr:glycosyltransferase family 39 protein [Deltaproteobacteria bacterium]